MSSQPLTLTYQPLCTIDAIPGVLVRAFEKEDYARQFMAGHIRFGLLQHYRKMEDSRGDKTEGEASIRWNLEAENPRLHNVTYTRTSLDLYYALCTSDPARKSQSTNFGSFVVQVNKPLMLLGRICEAWKSDVRASGDAFIVPVLYNKNELAAPPPYFVAPPCLVYAQKPVRYSHEAEYRYVICCKVGSQEDPFITLRVGSCNDICSLLFT